MVKIGDYIQNNSESVEVIDTNVEWICNIGSSKHYLCINTQGDFIVILKTRENTYRQCSYNNYV